RHVPSASKRRIGLSIVQTFLSSAPALATVRVYRLRSQTGKRLVFRNLVPRYLGFAVAIELEVVGGGRRIPLQHIRDKFNAVLVKGVHVHVVPPAIPSG